MSDDLFPTAVQPSPRLQWLEAHSIGIAENPNFVTPGQECDLTGKEVFKFAVKGWKDFNGIMRLLKVCGEGNTEEDAVADWARKAGVRLWNEEGYVAPRKEKR